VVRIAASSSRSVGHAIADSSIAASFAARWHGVSSAVLPIAVISKAPKEGWTTGTACACFVRAALRRA